jgi:hypothetical protein
MRTRRLIGSLLTTALVTSTIGVIATAAPASAATVVATRVVMQLSKTNTTVGDKISVTGQVQGQGTDGSWGQLPYDSGSASLQFLPKGGSSWQTLETDDQGYSFYFYPVRVTRPGTFRVSYAGGTNDANYDGTIDYQFNPASADKAPKVQRKLKYKEVPGRKAGIQGKVAPKAKLKIVVLKKVGKKYKKFKSVRTSRAGAFKIILPAPRNGRWYWRIVFPGTKGYAPSVVSGSTYSY